MTKCLNSISVGLLLTVTLACTCSAQFDFSRTETTLNSKTDVSVNLPPPTADLQTYALPVGQGDCTVIQCPNGNIVVLDCGSSGGNRLTPTQVDDFIQPQNNRVVAIVISHPDRDHFNYLYQINFNADSITQVIIGGTLQDYNRTSTEYAKIYNWLLNFQTMGKLYTVNNGASCIGTENCDVPLGTNFCNNQNIQFDVLAANVGTTSNQKSIVMKSVFGQFSMLLPGDMEGTAANTIATTLGQQLQSVVYKISHHGASTIGNSPTWLAPIQPHTAFASSAYDFGNNNHPRCVAIERILDLQTIVAAPSHIFYCGNAPGEPPTQYTNYEESIFETAPTPDSICLLTYLSSYQGSYECFDVSDVDDYLQPEEGGAQSLVANFLITIMIALIVNFVHVV